MRKAIIFPIITWFFFQPLQFSQPMNLSPEFQAKFFLRKAKKMIKHRNWKGVARALGKYDGLLDRHEREVVPKPDDFYFHYSYALCQIKKYTRCFQKASRYLKENGEKAPFATHAREMIKDFITVDVAISPRWTYLKAPDCAISFNNMNQDEMKLYAKPDQVCSFKFHKVGYESQEHTLIMSQTPNFSVTLQKLPEPPKEESVEKSSGETESLE